MREHSAGGVVIRREGDELEVAAIQPQGRPAGYWDALLDPVHSYFGARSAWDSTCLRSPLCHQ